MIPYKFLLILIFCNTLYSFNEKPLKTEFYAFANAMPALNYEQQAQLLKKLGYSGISQVFQAGDKLTRQVEVYKKYKLKVLSIYLQATEKPIDMNSIKALGNGGMIELTVHKINPQIIESIRQTSERAKKLNIRVALYPHHGFAVATIPQALELVNKVNHPNLGLMFNLCHFLKNEDINDLENILIKAKDKLFSVSINGADIDGKDWKTLIQSLDKGSFPQTRLISALKDIEFTGPISLQGFGIKGDKSINLENSMKRWKAISHELKD
ncbi:TIM barrel protein [Lentisphaera marina]|uniref:sugar phosphate isomerase/epimerase family protein n=1 Tax=Lentisphaera marina TaxID=1111041 RepID=UPI002366297D|nr:TIM barrel protein [Lentisphaera marina]MDD7985380.1 TIM barrel protein [Lentisphaera marina]